jgi:hypothetical protein
MKKSNTSYVGGPANPGVDMPFRRRKIVPAAMAALYFTSGPSERNRKKELDRSRNTMGRKISAVPTHPRFIRLSARWK